MKIGDRVSAIDEDLKGIVTSVHGDVVVLRDEHGFTHRYPISKVVLQNAALYEGIHTVQKAEIRKATSKKHHNRPMVLDLHFNNLVTHPADYDAFERLFIQKEKLVETLEFCRKNKLKKLEIIHGIGDGVLQNMVFDYLKSQTHLEFEDHDFFYHQTGSVLVTLK